MVFSSVTLFAPNEAVVRPRLRRLVLSALAACARAREPQAGRVLFPLPPRLLPAQWCGWRHGSGGMV
jgi:hypothetical protein